MNPASDFQIMTWSLEWWPWALRHGIDPLHTPLLWAPQGFSIVWITSIPVPALLAVPITATAGPLVAYNALMIAAVVLAAASAFLLCQELTRSVSASIFGGLLFGLSPYMLGHTLSQHLDLTFVFPFPLLVLLAVRFVRDKTTGRRYVLGSAVLLLVLFGSSLELFLDLAVLVLIVLVVAVAVAPNWRRPLLRLSGRVVLAYGICLPVIVPVAVAALRAPHAATQNAPAAYAADLLNFVVPTGTLLVGSLSRARNASAHFVGNIGERDAYVGLPLLVISALGLRASWRRGGWIAGLWILVAVLLSLGPILTVAGSPLVRLPFSTSALPVLRDALPARMSVFAALGFACLAAIWLARSRNTPLRVAVSLAVVMSLLPNFWPATRLENAWATTSAFGWSLQRPPAGFVRNPRWRRLVPDGSTVLVLPTRDRTAASYWQVEAGMEFANAVPETPFIPPAVAASPAVSRIAGNVLAQLDGTALGAARLRAFLVADRVRAVVVASPVDKRWLLIAKAATSARPVDLGGSLVFRVRRRLAPLLRNGERTRAVVRASRTRLSAWLHFDGRRARLVVSLARHRRDTTMTLSSPTGDAEGTSVALNAHGEAAVAFTEWRNGTLLFRAATNTGRGWRLVTLERTTSPIWSQQVTVTPSGTVVVAWIGEADPARIVHAAVLPADGRWQPPVTLDSGQGLTSVTAAAGSGDLAVIAWRDSLAGDSRVLAAEVNHRHWLPITAVTESSSWLDSVSLTQGARAIRWRARFGRARYLDSIRHGVVWSAPHSIRGPLPLTLLRRVPGETRRATAKPVQPTKLHFGLRPHRGSQRFEP
jgi:hypothetical protein